MHKTLGGFSLSVTLLASTLAAAAELQPPAKVTAGQQFAIPSTGSGSATFYLLGPSHVLKRKVQLGEKIMVDAADVTAAGRYRAIACGSDGCASASFYVVAAVPARLSFLLHPSRVPVTARDAINATAFVFDKYRNLVLRPTPVDFHVNPKNGAEFTRRIKSVRGVAFMRMSPTPKEGPVKVIASVGDTSEPRMIQQVAADACNLHIKATPTAKGVLVETDPVRDCNGNMVPDGTIVSFTQVDANGKTTVDAPIKKGVARAEMAVSGQARISVASGVVMGNEIMLAGRS
jgi:hypothetical protein